MTLRRSNGSERDVALCAPEGTRWGELAAAVARAMGDGAPPGWVDARPLTDGARLGRLGLVDGAVLSTVPSPDPARPAGLRLEIVGGSGAGRRLSSSRTAISVGRGPANTLVLDDPRVSRLHAVVALDGVRATVYDLGSTHGCTIDAQPVTGPAHLGPGALLRVGDTFLALSGASGSVASAEPEGAARTVAVPARPPASTPEPVIELPAPPEGRGNSTTLWLGTLLPAVSGLAVALVWHSPAMLLLAGLTPLAVLLGAVVERRRRGDLTRRSELAHATAAAAAHRRLADAARRETIARRRTSPDPAALARLASAGSGRLWQRRGHDPDLLEVRLGLALLPSRLRIRTGAGSLEPVDLPEVPFTVDLRQGALGIAAPAATRTAVAAWVVGQLAVLASPRQVEFAFLLADGGQWRWARWLPHVGSRVAVTPAAAAAAAHDIAALIRSRCAARSPARPWVGAWLVVIVEGGAGLTAALADCLELGPGVGVSAVCLADRESALPAGCRQLAASGGEFGARLTVGSTEVIADLVRSRWCDTLARKLAPYRAAVARRDAVLPPGCRLLDLLGLATPTSAEIGRRWARRTGVRVPLGMNAHGVEHLDLDRDGPHLLVAGTTGSGKSELLLALVAALAATRPPSDVTFLLVDYKGGAAFAGCAELPHTLGVVTDLDDALTRRVLTSLDSEIRRRERLLAAVDARDLAAYRAAGEALPRLIIVVDEFATLADEVRGFVPGLVSIAQRGRSLGMHLVLATQRPAGVVTRDIRANTGTRIALRTTSAADSLDVVDTDLAARLDARRPGRAVLRTGATTRLFQAARVTGAAPLEDPASPVRVLPLDAWRRPVPATGPCESTDTAIDEDQRPSDLECLVAAIRAAGQGLPAARRPWLPALPSHLAAEELPPEPTPGAVPVGLLDLPAEQRQPVLTVDLARGGVVLVAGRARSGRTTALETLARAGAARMGPSRLHIHAVALAGVALSGLRELPHAGTVVTPRDDPELIGRLVNRLAGEVIRRRSGGAARAHLLLLVDGWDALVDLCEHYDRGRTIDVLYSLMRDAPQAATTVAVSGSRSVLSPRLTALADSRLVLALHDASEYPLVGVDARDAPALSVPGRGLRAGDGVHLQFALPPRGGRAWPAPDPTPLCLRALPLDVSLADVAGAPGRTVLAVGGDTAESIAVDLRSGAGQLLVTGPPRSGRTTVLRCVLAQHDADELTVAAPVRSPLAAAAQRRRIPVVTPGGPPPARWSAIVLVDDADTFLGTETGDALAARSERDCADAVTVAAVRSDAAAGSFRGLVAAMRRSGAGLLLQPGAGDGELLGVALPRIPATTVPGRGVLVPDPAWRLYPVADSETSAALPVQAVRP